MYLNGTLTCVCCTSPLWLITLYVVWTVLYVAGMYSFCASLLNRNISCSRTEMRDFCSEGHLWVLSIGGLTLNRLLNLVSILILNLLQSMREAVHSSLWVWHWRVYRTSVFNVAKLMAWPDLTYWAIPSSCWNQGLGIGEVMGCSALLLRMRS